MAQFKCNIKSSESLAVCISCLHEPFMYLHVCNYLVVTCAYFALWDHVLPLCCTLGAVFLHYRKTESQAFVLSCVSSEQNCQLDPDCGVFTAGDEKRQDEHSLRSPSQDEFSAPAVRKTHLRLVH